MADILNVANSGGATSTLNTGTPLADIIRDIPYGIFLLDAGLEFDSSDRASIAAMVTALKTATRAARGRRVYPIWSLTNFEDQTKEATKAAIGNLSIQEIQLVDAIPAFAFQHRKGDLFHQLLLQAELGGFTICLLDKKYVLYGTKTSNGNFTGYTFDEFKTQLPKFQTPQAPSNYPFSIVFSSITEWKENFAFIQLDSTVASITGNRDVTLTLETLASNVAKVSLKGVGGKDIGDLFKTELADITGWVCTKQSDGSAFTLTSVAWDAANKRFNVTLDSTAFSGLSTGDKLNLNLETPANLLANVSVDGYESTGAVVVTKP